jgi:hypothetical protein
MDEQNFKFNYVFQGQDCTLSTGVYKITIQNHVYIGSAAISFRKRWRQHQLDFIRDIHHSRFAQNAFNKYGIAAFEIMELCPRELCIEREQWWIDTLKPDLNIQKIADSALGVKRTEETKRKCREAHLGKRLSEEAIAKRTAKQVKTIYQYDLDGNLIKEWDSVKQAGEALGINRPSISNCLKGRYKSAGGFIWRYSVEEVSPVKKTKSIEQYDLDGNLIKVWDSINSIENGTDYKRKTIYACANGQNSTAYGYVWKYCR